MKITTKSGSVYRGTVTRHPKLGPLLLVIKAGMEQAVPVIGVFPDRVPFVMATTSTEFDQRSGKVIGRNSAGVITLQFFATKVEVGMVLMNRRGFKSTEVVEVES